MSDVTLGLDINIGDTAQKLKNVENAITNVGNSMINTRDKTINTGFAMSGLNNIIRDMPFGFIAIQNNITQLSDYFMKATANGGTFGEAVKSLGSSLMGVGGLGIAISAVTTALTYYTMSSHKAKEASAEFDDQLKKIIETAKTGAEKLRDLQDTVLNLDFGQKNILTRALYGDLQQIEAEIKRLQNKTAGTSFTGGVGVGGRFVGGATKEEQEDLKKLNELQKAANAIYAERAKLETFLQGGAGAISKDYLIGFTNKDIETAKKDLKELIDSMTRGNDDAIQSVTLLGKNYQVSYNDMIALSKKLNEVDKEKKDKKENVIEAPTVDMTSLAEDATKLANYYDMMQDYFDQWVRNADYILQQDFDKRLLKGKQAEAKAEIELEKLKTKAQEDNLKESKRIKEAHIDLIADRIDAEIGAMDMTKNIAEEMANVARNEIKIYIAEAVAAQMESVFASTPFPFSLIVAPLAVAATSALFDSLIPKFATGGIVGGNSYFGDKVPAMVNSGEMILNFEQQKNLLDMASGRGVSVGSSEGKIDRLANALDRVGINVVIAPSESQAIYMKAQNKLSKGSF